MTAPRIVSVAAASPAQAAGLAPGDEIISIDGRVPRDVIEYQMLTDEPDPELAIRRGHEEIVVEISKHAGEPMGVEVSSAVFDRVRTCDNHCDFCFIYQLPKGMRKSLYLKDDDYRLSSVSYTHLDVYKRQVRFLPMIQLIKLAKTTTPDLRNTSVVSSVPRRRLAITKSDSSAINGATRSGTCLLYTSRCV